MNIKKGDSVVVISGESKDLGNAKKVLRAMPKENKLIVEGVNMIIRHTKPKKMGEAGGRIEKEAPIDASNVMVVCPVCEKATRVAYTIEGEKKARICKKCGALLDVTKEAKEVKKATKRKTKKAAADEAAAN